MLDLTKEYTTREGYQVVGLDYVPFNHAGGKVTFPIKGTIRVLPEGRIRATNRYCIWTEDGRCSLFTSNHPDDLVPAT